jgi:hypothetical protein
LYQWLKEFEFTRGDIYDLVESQSGKFFAPEYRLLKDREFLILR